MLDQTDQLSPADTLQLQTLQRSILLTAKSSSIIFAGKLFELGSAMVTAVLLARLLGAEDYGLYKLALTAVTVAASFTVLGLDTGLVHYAAIFASRRDRPGLWGAVQLGLGIPTLLSIVAGIAIFILAAPIASYFFHDLRLVPLLRLTSVIIPVFTLNMMVAAALKGLNQMQYMVIGSNFIYPIVRLVLIALIAIWGLTAARAVSAYNASVLVATVAILIFLNKMVPLRQPIQAARREGKALFRFSIPVYLSNTIGTFSDNIQTLLLGTFSTIANVGIFSLASQINMFGRLFHSSVSGAAMPIISALYDRKDWDQLHRFYQATSKWTFMLNFPMFLLLLTFPSAILSIFGESFAGGVAALAILSWANLAKTGTGICGMMISMTGHTRLRLFNSVVAIGTTLALNFYLIPRMGLLGAAYAVLANETINNLLGLIEVFILFRMLPYNRSYLKPITAGLLALGGALASSHFFHPQGNMLYTLIDSAVLMGIYVTLVLLMGLSEEDRMLIQHFRRRAASYITRLGNGAPPGSTPQR